MLLAAGLGSAEGAAVAVESLLEVELAELSALAFGASPFTLPAPPLEPEA